MADHIQIGDVAPRVSHAGDGAETDFTFPFPIFTDADLEVYVDGTKQVLSTGYTVSGAGQSAGGSVTFAAAPDDGAAILLLRRLTIARTSDFQASGEFRAKVINDELDFQTAVLQQINDDLGRTVRLQRTDAAASLELPDAATRAACALTFDGDGNADVTPLGEIGVLAVISSSTPSPASATGSAGVSTELSAADHSHPLPSLADLGIATEGEAVAGTDNTKAMTPLRTAQAIAAQFDGTDDVAREMAASALAYAMAANDASSITGSIGKFWLSDDFESDSLATSTNATYDATADMYSNPGDDVISAADFTISGNYTLSPDGHAEVSAMNSCGYRTEVLSGDFDLSWTWTTVASTGGITGIGVSFILASAIGGFSNSGADTVGGLQSPGTNIPFSFRNDSNQMHLVGNWSIEQSTTLSNGDTVRVTRESGTFKVYINSSLFRTMTVTSTADVHLSIGNGAAYTDVLDDITFAHTVGDMTLSPSAATLPTADPLDIVGYFVLEPIDTITFGTDIVGKVSIDGGTSKATGTWTKVGDMGVGGQELWRLEADVSAQSGTSLIYEITTFNSKQIRLHDCVGLIATY